MAIISASRRNDIPAFHGDWLMDRIHDGHVDVRARTGSLRVSLAPEDVDCIVLWTKDVRPMLASGQLDELRGLEIPFYVQHTLTGYGADIERGIRDKDDILAAMVELSRRFGPETLVWRYDPLLVAPNFAAEDHVSAFERMADALEGSCDECVVSNLDVYGKLEARLAGSGIRPLTAGEAERVVPALVEAGRARGIRLSACAEPAFHGLGVAQAHCVDANRVERVCGHSVDATKDPSQRRLCGCVSSIDIGWYGHCAHNCAYCYANR